MMILLLYLGRGDVLHGQVLPAPGPTEEGPSRDLYIPGTVALLYDPFSIFSISARASRCTIIQNSGFYEVFCYV